MASKLQSAARSVESRQTTNHDSVAELPQVPSSVDCDVPEVSSEAIRLNQVASAAARGDAAAAEALLLEIGDVVLRSVRRVLGAGHAELDDVAQEATITFLSSLKRFRGEGSVARFASRVALLTAMSARRGMKRRESRISHAFETMDWVEDNAGTPLTAVLAQRRRELLLETLDELSEPIAEALALHFMLGYTVEEVAAVANVSQNTIWSRLRLGKQALRRRLSLKETLGGSENAS